MAEYDSSPTGFTRRDLGSLMLVAGLSPAIPQSLTDQQNREWSVGPKSCLQRLVLDNGSFRLASLVNGADGQEWIHPAQPSEEFLFRLSTDQGSSSEYTGASGWRFVAERVRPAERGWQGLEIVLEAKTAPIRVIRHYLWNTRLPLLRQWTSLENAGERTLTVTRLDTFRIRLSPSPNPLELRWMNNFCRAMAPSPGNPIHSRSIDENVEQLIRTGPYSPDCAWFCLTPLPSRAGLIGGWEWSGPMEVRWTGGLDPCLLEGGLDPASMAEPLAPHASISSPIGWYGFYAGGQDGAAALSHTLVREGLGPKLPERNFPWAGYCSWSSAIDRERNPANEPGTHPWFPTEKNLLGQVQAAAELGCEMFLWDYGWFPRVGDWWFDQNRFLQGSRAVKSAVRAHGMKLGLWFGFGNADAESKVVREHPDWLAEYNGKPIPDDFFIRTAASTWNTRILCLAHKPVREWVKQQLSRVIDETELDWFKHDFDLITICQARHHTHTAGDGRIAACEAFYEVMDFVRARYPSMVCEHWMNDSATPDYGVVQRHHVQLIGDAYEAFRLRQMVYGHSQIFPLDRQHRYLRVEDSPGELDTVLRSSMIGGPWTLLSDPRMLSSEQRNMVSAEIANYKRFRGLFGGARFHRLAGRPHQRGWDAFQFGDGAGAEGAIYVFRNDHPKPALQLNLRGLDAGSSYVAEFLGSRNTVKMTGAELQEKGLPVKLASRGSSEIIALRISR
jgi:alpha-galactosidase